VQAFSNHIGSALLAIRSPRLRHGPVRKYEIAGDLDHAAGVNHAHRDLFFVAGEAGEIAQYGSSRRSGDRFPLVAQIIVTLNTGAPLIGFPSRSAARLFLRSFQKCRAPPQKPRRCASLIPSIARGLICNKIVESLMRYEGQGCRACRAQPLAQPDTCSRDAGCAEPPCWKHQAKASERVSVVPCVQLDAPPTGHDRQSCIPAIDDETMRGAIRCLWHRLARQKYRQEQRAPQGVSLISPAPKISAAHLRRQACLHQDFRSRANPEAVFVMEAYQANRTRVFDNAAPWRLGEDSPASPAIAFAPQLSIRFCIRRGGSAIDDPSLRKIVASRDAIPGIASPCSVQKNCLVCVSSNPDSERLRAFCPIETDIGWDRAKRKAASIIDEKTKFRR